MRPRIGRQLPEQADCVSTTGAPESSQHERQARARVARVQRHIRAAGLQDAEHATISSSERRGRSPPAHRVQRCHGDQLVGQLVGAAIELGIGQLPVPQHDRHRVRASRGLRLEQLRDAAVARVVGRRGIPNHQQLLALGCSEQRQRINAARVGHDRPQKHVRIHRAMRSIVGRSNRSVAKSTAARQAPAWSRAQSQSNFAVSPSSKCGDGCTSSPGKRRAPRARSADTNSTWKSGLAAGSRRGAAPRPASRTAGPGAHRRPARSRAPRPAARESAGRPTDPQRSTSVLTKKPISPSSSARVRPAIGDPTAMSSCPL